MVLSAPTMVPIDYVILQTALSLVKMRHGADPAVVDHFINSTGCDISIGKCDSSFCISNMDNIGISNGFGYFHKTNKPTRIALLRRMADLIFSEIPRTETKEFGIQTEIKPTVYEEKSNGKKNTNSKLPNKLFSIKISLEAERQELIRSNVLIEREPVWKTENVEPKVIQRETCIKPTSVITDKTKKRLSTTTTETLKKDCINKLPNKVVEVIDLVEDSSESENCLSDCSLKKEADMEIDQEVPSPKAEAEIENVEDSKLDNDVKLDTTSNEESSSNGEEKTDLVPIGFGRAKVNRSVLNKIAKKDYKQATRKLLTEVFTRQTLATSSLTGKCSPAFPGRAAKVKLAEDLVVDIIKYVLDNYGGTNERSIKTCITHKCADESKIARNKCKKLAKK